MLWFHVVRSSVIASGIGDGEGLVSLSGNDWSIQVIMQLDILDFSCLIKHASLLPSLTEIAKYQA